MSSGPTVQESPTIANVTKLPVDAPTAKPIVPEPSPALAAKIKEQERQAQIAREAATKAAKEVENHKKHVRSTDSSGRTKSSDETVYKVITLTTETEIANKVTMLMIGQSFIQYEKDIKKRIDDVDQDVPLHTVKCKVQMPQPIEYQFDPCVILNKFSLPKTAGSSSIRTAVSRAMWLRGYFGDIGDNKTPSETWSTLSSTPRMPNIPDVKSTWNVLKVHLGMYRTAIEHSNVMWRTWLLTLLDAMFQNAHNLTASGCQRVQQMLYTIQRAIVQGKEASIPNGLNPSFQSPAQKFSLDGVSKRILTHPTWVNCTTKNVDETRTIFDDPTIETYEIMIDRLINRHRACGLGLDLLSGIIRVTADKIINDGKTSVKIEDDINSSVRVQIADALKEVEATKRNEQDLARARLELMEKNDLINKMKKKDDERVVPVVGEVQTEKKGVFKRIKYFFITLKMKICKFWHTCMAPFRAIKYFFSLKWIKSKAEQQTDSTDGPTPDEGGHSSPPKSTNDSGKTDGASKDTSSDSPRNAPLLSSLP